MFEMFIINTMQQLYEYVCQLGTKFKNLIYKEACEFIHNLISFQIFLWKWSFIASFVLVFGIYILNATGIFSIEEITTILGGKK